MPMSSEEREAPLLSDWDRLEPVEQAIAMLAALYLESKGYTMQLFMAEHGLPEEQTKRNY